MDLLEDIDDMAAWDLSPPSSLFDDFEMADSSKVSATSSEDTSVKDDAYTPEAQSEEEEDRKCSKKRKTPNTSSPLDDQEGVTLSRERLLTITSDEFDAHIERLAAAAKLSSAQQSEVRRQRRLIKNRESAAASRERKKAHVTVLQEENAQLRSHIAQLELRLRSAGLPVALFAVLFGFALLWTPASTPAPSAASPNLRCLMGHELLAEPVSNSSHEPDLLDDLYLGHDATAQVR